MTNVQAIETVFSKLPSQVIAGICDVRAYDGAMMHDNYGEYEDKTYDSFRPFVGTFHSDEYLAWVDGHAGPSEHTLKAIVQLAQVPDGTTQMTAAATWAKQLLREQHEDGE